MTGWAKRTLIPAKPVGGSKKNVTTATTITSGQG